jgi:hypothetical protein
VTLTIQHVRLGNVDDTHGVLVFVDDLLVAVLAELSAEHDTRAGAWFLECGFGAGLERDETFIDLQSACDWIEVRIEHRDHETVRP